MSDDEENVERQEVISSFVYNDESGKLFWNNRPRHHFSTDKSWRQWHTRFQGKEAGTVLNSKKSKTLYRIVKIFGRMILVHKIVWLIKTGEWPKDTIDHKDGDGLNNKYSNLREASTLTQMKNKPRYSNNTSGVTGVSWNSSTNKWIARISIDGKEKCLGGFKDFSQACDARASAEDYFGYTVERKDRNE